MSALPIFPHVPLARLQMMCRYKRVATWAKKQGIYQPFRAVKLLEGKLHQEPRTSYTIWSLELKRLASDEFSLTSILSWEKKQMYHYLG